MANYYATIRTNHFSVKDEAKFREIIESCSAEDEIHIFEAVLPDGNKVFGFGCYGSVYGFGPDEDNPETDIDGFYYALQEVLAEDDAIIITEVGNEKLRYLIACCTVLTKDAIQFVDARNLAVELARTMLNNDDFQTQMDY